MLEHLLRMFVFFPSVSIPDTGSFLTSLYPILCEKLPDRNMLRCSQGTQNLSPTRNLHLMDNTATRRAQQGTFLPL